MASTTTQRGSEVLTALVETIWAWAAEETYLSKGRCCDQFLDLYNATDLPAVRREVVAFLEVLSCRTIVTADEVRHALRAVCAAAEVETAFDHLVVGDSSLRAA